MYSFTCCDAVINANWHGFFLHKFVRACFQGVINVSAIDWCVCVWWHNINATLQKVESLTNQHAVLHLGGQICLCELILFCQFCFWFFVLPLVKRIHVHPPHHHVSLPFLFILLTYSFFFYEGRVRTQSPTTRNDAVEISTFEEFAEVSHSFNIFNLKSLHHSFMSLYLSLLSALPL